MIRTLDFVCSECGEHFTPGEKLYYRDNYMNNSIRDTKFICPACIAKWRKNGISKAPALMSRITC